MLDDPVLFEDGVEDFQRSSTIDKEIFGDDFEPIHHRLFLKDMPVVRDPEADSDSVVCPAVEGIGWHAELPVFAMGGRRWPHRPCEFNRLLFGTVGGATAFSFAAILAFAAVVSGLASAMTLAAILAFAGVFPLVIHDGDFCPGVRGCGCCESR